MKKGDPKDSFQALYRENAGTVGRFLFSILPDELDAEDLCQEVFLRHWKENPASMTQADLLLVSTKLLRKYGKRTRGAKYKPIRPVSSKAAGTPLGKLRAAWEELPLSERMAIALTMGSGLSPAAAAPLLRSGVPALRGRVVRGLLRMGTYRAKESSARLPRICAAGEKRILSDEWENHSADCRKCVKAAPVLEEGLRSAERLFSKAFPARTKQRLLRRLLKDLPTMAGTLLYDSITSPIGTVWIGMLDGAVVNIAIADRSESEFIEGVVPRVATRAVRDRTAVRQAGGELEEYFAGKRTKFTFPYRLVDVTPFQSDVLAACTRVPFGRVSSYGELADRVGRPRATRAVGGALGINPLPLIIPCHRILSSKGNLQGFSGGLDVKEILLALEGRAGLFSAAPRSGTR